MPLIDHTKLTGGMTTNLFEQHLFEQHKTKYTDYNSFSCPTQWGTYNCIGIRVLAPMNDMVAKSY